MADGDFLDRLDAHMERSNEHMERGNELMAENKVLMKRGDELMGEVRNEVRLTREFMADNRVFTQQMIARVDRMTRDNSQLMGSMAERVDRGTDELVRQGAARHEESLAERKARLAMIDRIDRFDPPSAAA